MAKFEGRGNAEGERREGRGLRSAPVQDKSLATPIL